MILSELLYKLVLFCDIVRVGKNSYCEFDKFEVLCGEFELAAIDLERKSLQSDKRRGKHNLKIAAGVDAAAEATEVEAGLAWSEVHFPVCNYVFFSGTSHT